MPALRYEACLGVTPLVPFDPGRSVHGARLREARGLIGLDLERVRLARAAHGGDPEADALVRRRVAQLRA